MKPLIIILVALVAAGGVWWITTTGEDTSEPNNSSATSTVETESAVSSDAEDAAVTEAGIETSDNVLPDDNTSVDQSTEASAENEPAESATDSPFAVVEGEVGDTSPADEPVDGSQSQPLPSTNADIANSDTSGDGDSDQRTLEPIVVPSSYPVTDAEKYFIPKEERGPGRLGGPPPLDFPGGPSDPNREGNAPFQPPAAPGQ